MPESTNLNRNVNKLNTTLESLIYDGSDRLKTIGRDEYTFIAAALTSNVSHQVLLSPTSTTVELIIKTFCISVADNSGVLDLESSSTDVGVGGVFARMYATKYQNAGNASAHIPLGIGQTLKVTSTTGGAAFICINYVEE